MSVMREALHPTSDPTRRGSTWSTKPLLYVSSALDSFLALPLLLSTLPHYQHVVQDDWVLQSCCKMHVSNGEIVSCILTSLLHLLRLFPGLQFTAERVQNCEALPFSRGIVPWNEWEFAVLCLHSLH